MYLALASPYLSRSHVQTTLSSTSASESEGEMASSKPVPIVLGDLHDGAFFAHASQPATRPPHGQRADATASCSVRGVDANVGDDEINEGEQPQRRGIDAATHALCVGSPRVVAPPVAPPAAPPAAQPAKSP